MSKTILVEHLSKTYSSSDGPVPALDDMTLNAEAGEFISVVGPSGCGKSTLLMLVAGLRSPSTGKVIVNGQMVTGPQTDVGIVFQTDALLAWRTNCENVLLQADMRGIPRKRHLNRALDLLNQVGLGGFENRLPGELSGGMRQRVSICRALVHDPGMLLMDEPFGALDALTREQMMVDLQSLWLRRRNTVLFITHSIIEAVFLSDRVVVMSARPGQLKRVIDIRIARPRDIDVMSTPAFNEYVANIRTTFEEMGVIRRSVSVQC